MKKFSYESMGTNWEITLWDSVDDIFFKNLETEIVSMSEKFDRTYSRFIKTSLVWKVAEKAGVYEVPQDFMTMLKIYIDLYELSEKKLNPLIGFTISDLGYDEFYSLTEKDSIRHTPDLLETVGIIDPTHIETTLPVLFDFGAIGKGFFVDKISSYLISCGCKRFLIDGSGDIYYSGNIPISVGLEHPDGAHQVVGKIEMMTGAMCASGINRRKWGIHHHVIDPYTNNSLDSHIKASWVVAENTALADALATCLFFVSAESLTNYSFEYVVMNKDNMIKKSSNWKGEIF